MTLASRSTLNHSNRSNEHQEKPLSNSAQESRCRKFSVFFWNFGKFRISPPIQKCCGQIRKKWLNRKLGKVLKQQIHGSNPRKTQRDDRSVEIPFGYFWCKIFEIGKNKKNWGGKKGWKWCQIRGNVAADTIWWGVHLVCGPIFTDWREGGTRVTGRRRTRGRWLEFLEK